MVQNIHTALSGHKIQPKVGVYVCCCGINIASIVDVPAVAKLAGQIPGVLVARDYIYMCSEPGQALIKEDIARYGLNRVVVASCSPLLHEPTFRNTLSEAGLNPYCLEMANIREQCAWVHTDSKKSTEKAYQLIASAVAKAKRLYPLEIRQVGVTPQVLVIGGGVAGMQAALDVANAGFQVFLVEKCDHLGGTVACLDRTFPTLESAVDIVNHLVESVGRHPRITQFLNTEVRGLEGYVGNFTVQLKTTLPGENLSEMPVLKAGAIILATGFEVFDARLKPELGYGVYPQVITTLDFETLARERRIANMLTRTGAKPHVVFIQCVGSRDQTATVQHPYCSRICCMVTAKQARTVRELIPDAQVTVFYMDVRAFGKGFEEFYDATRECGVLYRRGNPSEIIRRDGRLVVRVEDTLLGEEVEEEADLVVLAVGMTPRPDAGHLAAILKLSRSADGFFLEAHPKLRPVETAVAGVYLAGCCQGPKDMAESITQASAAASEALIGVMQGQIRVEAATAFIEEELCAGCGQCQQVCPFSALKLHPLRGVMTVSNVLCQGCGACAAACPSGAINVNQSTFEQIIAQVETLI